MERFWATFSSTPNGETMDGTKKSLELKDGTDHLYHRAKFGANSATETGVLLVGSRMSSGCAF